MNTIAVLATLFEKQLALSLIVLLELTGWMFPPPAALKDGHAFDYIIVGGGTAGSVIATRLVQKKYNVLLIEAGKDAPYESTLPGLLPYLKNSQVDWNLTTTKDEGFNRCHVGGVVELGVGKMLGGTGELNNMIYARGSHQVYDNYVRETNDNNWTWSKMLPYLMKAENLTDTDINYSETKYPFGTKGYIGVTRDDDPDTDDYLDGFRQIGKDIIPDIDGNRIGYARGLVTIKDGFRQGAGSQYLRHISESRYIATAKNTTVTRVLFDSNKTVTGVEVITDKGKYITIKARREVILSAGVFGTPKILLLSGIGPKEDLDKLNITTISDLPVGKDIQGFKSAFIPFKTNRKIVDKEKGPGKYPTGLFVGYASLNESSGHKEHPDYSVVGHIIDDMRFLLQFCGAINRFLPQICNKLYEEANDNQVLITMLTNLTPNSRGQLKLQSTDPTVPPKIVACPFSNQRSLEDLIDYIHHYLEVLESPAFQELEVTKIDLVKPMCDAFEKGTREYSRCCIFCLMVNTGSYGSGCAVMKVMDSKLRVYGVKGLRISDASGIPTLTSPYLFNTVVMIGESTADLIIADAGDYNNMKHEKVGLDEIKNMPDD